MKESKDGISAIFCNDVAIAVWKRIKESSLCIKLATSHPPNPKSISKPLMAGILSMIYIKMAFSLSKYGSFNPMRQFQITHVTVSLKLESPALHQHRCWY